MSSTKIERTGNKFLPLLAVTAVMAGGCGSITVPAAVRLPDDRLLTGSTTASLSGAGNFEVATPDRSVSCSAKYDALDMTSTITVPFTCSDGRTGTAVITRDASGTAGSGFAQLSDGTSAKVAFGQSAVLMVPSDKAPQAAEAAATAAPAATPARRYYSGRRGGCYYLTSSGSKQYVDRSNCS